VRRAVAGEPAAPLAVVPLAVVPLAVVPLAVVPLVAPQQCLGFRLYANSQYLQLSYFYLQIGFFIFGSWFSSLIFIWEPLFLFVAWFPGLYVRKQSIFAALLFVFADPVFIIICVLVLNTCSSLICICRSVFIICV
jgi:hypothetical protein